MYVVGVIIIIIIKRACCLRVKAVLKLKGSRPQGPVSAFRRKGLEEVVGWAPYVLDYGRLFAV